MIAHAPRRSLCTQTPSQNGYSVSLGFVVHPGGHTVVWVHPLGGNHSLPARLRCCPAQLAGLRGAGLTFAAPIRARHTLPCEPDAGTAPVSGRYGQQNQSPAIIRVPLLYGRSVPFLVRKTSARSIRADDARVHPVSGWRCHLSSFGQAVPHDGHVLTSMIRPRRGHGSRSAKSDSANRFPIGKRFNCRPRPASPTWTCG